MVSIVVPTLNEEKTISKTLEQLISLEGEKEIIVVDGGSSDNTIKEASKYAKVISSEKGRSNQMNAGAKASSGEVLWFVHSDSILNTKSIIYINEAINKGKVGGGFNLYFYDMDTLFMKFVEVTSNMRGKFMKLVYGDQGIFVRKDIFESIGGFPKLEIMEDWEFSLRLRKKGKMTMINTKIGTSARRFKNGGQLKTLLLMHKMKILYSMGVDSEKLSKMYREAR